MGIAREIKLAGQPTHAQFLLAQEHHSPVATVQQTLNQLPRPLDLWLVNFHAPTQFNNCLADSRLLPPVNGYDYKLYHCEQN